MSKRRTIFHHKTFFELWTFWEMLKHFYKTAVEQITNLIVNFYQNSFLIEAFFVFLKVFGKVLKNVHSSHQ